MTPCYFSIKRGSANVEVTGFKLAGDGTLSCQDRLYVPDNEALQENIMSEAPCPWYSIHPGSTKMYHDLKEVY